ncbi:hypothetical protein [Kallotenue papyrolyticum]|uniref:hypothetical protein n=1 Tax=Kallotenue papyrolyticum TaxID=1325125 RepID=UPI0004786560|nr:hypothetical protein [Kallotenue papyrolyticum]
MTSDPALMSPAVRPLDQVLQAVETWLRLGMLDQAARALAALTDVYPDAQPVQMLSGWLALERGQPARAVVAFRLAAGRDPTWALAWHGVAETSPDPGERAEAAERAQNLRPDGPYARIWSDLRHGRAHLAITPLRALCARCPERPELVIWLAEAYRRLDQPDPARALLEPLLRRRPRPVPALWLAAALALDSASAHELRREALRFDPLGSSLRALVEPNALPLALPGTPFVALPAELAAELETLPLAHAERPRSVAPLAAPRAAKSGATAQPGPPDREVEAVLRTVEQATERLMGRAPLALPDGQATTLLVAHRGALAASYGAATAEAILNAMAAYGDALARRGVHARHVILDDHDALAAYGAVPPVGERTPIACKTTIDRVCAALAASGETVDAIVLIGGDEHIPFHRLPNPSQDADADVPSDNPYGCGDGSDLAPAIIVARFPDGGADGGRLLLEQLERAADYHQTWHLTGPQGTVLMLPLMRRLARAMQAGAPVTGWGLSAEAWSVPSQTVYGELGAKHPLLLCPPLELQALPELWPSDDCRVLYFNVHGIQGGPNWYGQPREGDPDASLPVALTPEGIGRLSPAAICVSEACFGADIVGRSARDAIALRLLEQGALAFIGSTVTAYGAVALPLGGADLLVQQVFQNLRRGYPLGRALALARDWMAREMVQRQGYLDPDDAKTLLSFVLLGDPWATPYTRPALERKTVPQQVRPVVAQRRPVPADLIAPPAAHLARALIAKVAPHLARAPLSAAGQARPDRIAKGLASALVFSARDRLRTDDGRVVEQIARVTVSGAEARKILLSR